MGRVELREQVLQAVQRFNLFSNAFMKVVFRDPLACQHVLRILSGNPELSVTAVRTEYEIAKVTSHDSRLDVLAEDQDGKLYNLELQRKETLDHARRVRFKTADPYDSSQGDLSKRVHFLKCEKEGKEIMCKVTDELIEIGKEIGEERSAKRIVLRMAERGKTLSEIIDNTGVSLELATSWMKEAAVAGS